MKWCTLHGVWAGIFVVQHERHTYIVSNSAVPSHSRTLFLIKSSRAIWRAINDAELMITNQNGYSSECVGRSFHVHRVRMCSFWQFIQRWLVSVQYGFLCQRNATNAEINLHATQRWVHLTRNRVSVCAEHDELWNGNEPTRKQTEKKEETKWNRRPAVVVDTHRTSKLNFHQCWNWSAPV